MSLNDRVEAWLKGCRPEEYQDVHSETLQDAIPNGNRKCMLFIEETGSQ